MPLHAMYYTCPACGKQVQLQDALAHTEAGFARRLREWYLIPTHKKPSSLVCEKSGQNPDL